MDPNYSSQADGWKPVTRASDFARVQDLQPQLQSPEVNERGLPDRLQVGLVSAGIWRPRTDPDHCSCPRASDRKPDIQAGDFAWLHDLGDALKAELWRRLQVTPSGQRIRYL